MEELPIQPSGLFWQDDFITAEHEARLVHIFRHELAWPERSGRLSLHYGYTFDYKTFGVDPDIPFAPFPDWLQPLIPTTEGRPPDQVCLQHYPPGAGIPPHVDTHSAYDQLYALSLGSPVMMQFARPASREGEGDGDGDGRAGEMVEVDLAPRSMMQMSGDSRLHWKHGIRKRKTDTLADGTVRKRGDRWSITYRWIREPAICECGDAQLCDTAQTRLGVEREYRWKKGDEDGAAGGANPAAEDAKT
ncbi:Alkylated DNA repair protein ALKBH8-like protein [Colletotrichum shisoi]|uniref:Alkylated DNA repair protein ALKBH8-like protein n=1 Tax=Colletotrichum shisoi TaxID=2078593 RepID=A0A5Q4BMA7_9PEZI|nr:Alkylated DNA repair protein ALKBH8-like protein [Colletotrichum shisoi]